MILIHELGHFAAALLMGVRVETFSIGFGPRLFGFRRGDTDFRVSAFFFGGYVKMLGDQPGDESTADPRSFQAKARSQRAFIIFAGPFMNVLLAVGLIAGLYMYGFPKEVETSDPVITSLETNSSAAQAGLKTGDKIIQIGSHKDPTWTDVLTTEALNANHAIPVIAERAGQRLHFLVTPAMDPKEGVGDAGWRGEQNIEVWQVMKGSPADQAGLRPNDLLIAVNGRPVVSPVSIQQAVVHSAGNPLTISVMRDDRIQPITVTPVRQNDPKLPWHIGIGFKMRAQIVRLGLGPAIVESVRQNAQNATLLFRILGSLVEHRVSAKTLSGPIGIAQMSSEAAQQGAQSFIDLMAIISLQLAIFNLFPVPVLDGGTLLLLFIEMLLQREMSLRVRETVFKLGFVFLMMVVVFAIYNDISRILTHS